MDLLEGCIDRVEAVLEVVGLPVEALIDFAEAPIHVFEPLVNVLFEMVEALVDLAFEVVEVFVRPRREGVEAVVVPVAPCLLHRSGRLADNTFHVIGKLQHFCEFFGEQKPGRISGHGRPWL